MGVNKKYDSLQEEARNYPHFDISKYNKAKIKTSKYLKTEQIKKTKAKWTYHQWGTKQILLEYEINKDGVITFGHLLSLNLYTDYTKLSTAFSASFRKSNNFETLQSIKKRNALFFWMSRYLRELVEIFGQCSRGDTFEKDKYRKNIYSKPLDALPGYFFCGMNIKLNIPSFAMRLNSPTSTSKQIEVAMKFSGPKGMVFTFDTPSNKSQYKYLRAWNCSWISNFKEEDEVLFFGGYFRIK